jgi:hypothetical protein
VIRNSDQEQKEETSMTAISKGFSLLAISVALTLSGGPVMAKGGGGPSQVKTSGNSGTQGGNSGTQGGNSATQGGNSASQGGNAAGGSIAHRSATGCGHATHGTCAFPSQGATSGKPGTGQPHASPEIGITAQ